MDQNQADAININDAADIIKGANGLRLLSPYLPHLSLKNRLATTTPKYAECILPALALALECPNEYFTPDLIKHLVQVAGVNLNDPYIIDLSAVQLRIETNALSQFLAWSIIFREVPRMAISILQTLIAFGADPNASLHFKVVKNFRWHPDDADAIPHHEYKQIEDASGKMSLLEYIMHKPQHQVPFDCVACLLKSGAYFRSSDPGGPFVDALCCMFNVYSRNLDRIEKVMKLLEDPDIQSNRHRLGLMHAVQSYDSKLSIGLVHMYLLCAENSKDDIIKRLLMLRDIYKVNLHKTASIHKMELIEFASKPEHKEAVSYVLADTPLLS